MTRRGDRGREGPSSRPRRTPRADAAPAQVRIESIAAGGEGVGHLPDGRVIFVHRTAPGDVAEVAVTERQKRWARGRVLRVLELSSERREAPCEYYAQCGGCTLEHMHYPAQLRAKARIVADALERIGGIATEVPAVVPSPEEFRYRNRVSFALRREGSGRVTAGFHALGDPGRVIDVGADCLLPEAAISQVWSQIRERWGPDARRLPSGEHLRLTLRANTRGEVSLLVQGGFSPGRPQELIDEVQDLVAVWHQPGEAAAILTAGAPGLPDTWGDETVELSGAAFLQVNRGAAVLLEEHVAEVAGDVSGLRVIDAYCGIGLHARRFARAGAQVVGIELDADAVGEASRSAPEGARFEQGAVEALLPEHLPADVVVLNPPRAGVATEVTDALAANMPARIIYISCNPATLARDLRRLNSRVRLEHVRCFDLFPQTAHVETVAVLSPQHP